MLTEQELLAIWLRCAAAALVHHGAGSHRAPSHAGGKPTPLLVYETIDEESTGGDWSASSVSA